MVHYCAANQTQPGSEGGHSALCCNVTVTQVKSDYLFAVEAIFKLSDGY